MAMKRTQIYIPLQIHTTAKMIARRTKRPLADLYRTYIEGGIRQELGETKSRGLERLAKLGMTGGPKDLSTYLDDYLYGGKK